MSNLSSTEKRKIEKLFEMGSGYVLNFSDRTFQEFISENTGIDIDDSKYKYEGRSKANRLRAFWNKESNYVVEKLISNLLEYWRTDKLTKYIKISQEEQTLFDECAKIAERLKQDSIVENLDTIPKLRLDTEHLQIYIERIKASIETDPSLAIGSTKELIEATLKTILNGCGSDYDDKKDDIPKLLKQVQKVLELAPEEVDSSKKGADIIKRVLNNLGSVAVGIAELRNLYGSGHGKGQKSPGLTARHAKLVVGAGTTLCAFLLETYEHRKNVDF